MINRNLIDTNVLVYAYDFSEPKKQAIASEILGDLAENETGLLSTQVLSEFFVVVTRKLAAPLSAAEAGERLDNLIRIWPVAEITPLLVIEAARGVRQHQLSFWDALIWATAKFNQAKTVLSEDFSSGQILEGIEFVNPF